MRTTTLTRRTTFGAVAALTLAAAAAGVVAAPAASAASVAGTLSATSGPSGGGNTLTITTATAKFVASSTFVEFQAKATATSTCAANYATANTTVTATAGVIVVNDPGAALTAHGGQSKILSSTKLAVTVPDYITAVTAGSTQTYNICVYNGKTTGSSSLTANIVIVNAAYTVAAAPTITTISPAGGPALGGGSVTVNGTNFVTGMSAKFGSAALTNIVVASNGNSFTATVPPQSSGAYNLSVTTPGGTKNKTAGNAYVPYTYSNGIVVTPNTTPTATSVTDLDIVGVGFASLDFSTTTGSSPVDAHAHVFVVAGAYDASAAPKPNGELGECVNVLVISDTELVCTVNTALAFNQSGDDPIDNGTYTITVVSDGNDDIASGGANEDLDMTQSVISSGSTFTVADY